MTRLEIRKLILETVKVLDYNTYDYYAFDMDDDSEAALAEVTTLVYNKINKVKLPKKQIKKKSR